jgi:hypothetical protein
MYREAGYVAMSRATSGTDMFVVTSAFDDGRATEVPDGHGGLVRALSASQAKELAVESLGPVAQRGLGVLPAEDDRPDAGVPGTGAQEETHGAPETEAPDPAEAARSWEEHWAWLGFAGGLEDDRVAGRDLEGGLGL